MQLLQECLYCWCADLICFFLPKFLDQNHWIHQLLCRQLSCCFKTCSTETYSLTFDTDWLTNTMIDDCFMTGFGRTSSVSAFISWYPLRWQSFVQFLHIKYACLWLISWCFETCPCRDMKLFVKVMLVDSWQFIYFGEWYIGSSGCLFVSVNWMRELPF